MTNFRIWGHIEHVGPSQFFVAVSKVAAIAWWM
jgi:hypothetical protein